MKLIKIVSLVLFISVFTMCSSTTLVDENSKNRIWYTAPAQNWNEALQVGNGRLGAMVFGNVTKKRKQLNEDTVWSGRPHDYTNPNAVEHLAKTREMIFNEHFVDIEKYIHGVFILI